MNIEALLAIGIFIFAVYFVLTWAFLPFTLRELKRDNKRLLNMVAENTARLVEIEERKAGRGVPGQISDETTPYSFEKPKR